MKRSVISVAGILQAGVGATTGRASKLHFFVIQKVLRCSVIDYSARNTGIELLRKMDENRLCSSDFEDKWPKKTKDNAVNSIGYWVWTLFDDYHDIIIEIKENSEEKIIIMNSIEFLNSDRVFHPKMLGRYGKIKKFISEGTEWLGCELPWHKKWPFPE